MRSTKKRSNKKTKNKIKNIIASILSLILILIIGVIINKLDYFENYINEYFNLNNETTNTINQNNTTNRITAEESQNVVLDDNKEIIQIHFFDVGQADSMLIISNNETMLIDAGNNEDGKLVVDNIKKLGIEKLDYVVGTHPHEDHIGGLDDVIKNFDIGTIYMPKIQTNTKTFEDVLDSIMNKNLSITAPKVGDKFKVGNIECEIMSCGEGTEEEKNNLNLSSIVIRAIYDEQSYLFMGDSEKENEISRTWPKTNVLKVGHHGSSTSSSKEFLNQVLPQIAIIQVGKDNKYSHPKQTILDRLNKLNVVIYRTDEKGNILVESDGINNKVSFY